MTFSENEIIKIKGIRSKVNFSLNKDAILNVTEVRFLKEYKTELPVLTDKKFLSLVNKNSYENVILQSKKVIAYDVEISAKENTNLQILKECELIKLIDKNNNSKNVQISEITEEFESDTTLKNIKYTFIEILKDKDSLVSHAESSYVFEKIGNGEYEESIYLQIENNKNIDSIVDFENGETLKFYTLFYPEIKREMIAEDTILNFSKNGKMITISSFDCENVKIRLFLNNENLVKLQKYIKRAWFIQNGQNKGVKIIVGSLEYQAEQTINADDIEINTDNSSLVNLTEITITLKRDFINYNIC